MKQSVIIIKIIFWLLIGVTLPVLLEFTTVDYTAGNTWLYVMVYYIIPAASLFVCYLEYNEYKQLLVNYVAMHSGCLPSSWTTLPKEFVNSDVLRLLKNKGCDLDELYVANNRIVAYNKKQRAYWRVIVGS